MSSLWTPGGEHPVGDGEGAQQPQQAQQPPPGPAPDGLGDDADPLAGLSAEEREQAEEMAARMADVQRQMLEAPAENVVANHAMGLYELAAIHLSADEPKLDDAQLAIDAMSALVDGLEGRMGESESTLREARGQLQMAFVQIRDRLDSSD